MDDPGGSRADVGGAAPVPEDDAAPGAGGLRVTRDCHFVDIAVRLNYNLKSTGLTQNFSVDPAV